MKVIGKVATVIGIIACSALLPFAGLMALISPMIFDAPGSTKHPLGWIFFLLSVASPAALLFLLVFLIRLLTKERRDKEKTAV